MSKDPDVARFLDLLAKVGNGRSARRAGELLGTEISGPITINWNIRIQPQADGELKVTDKLKYSEGGASMFVYNGTQLELLLKVEA